MHRVDEEMRRREEVFERMRRVPAAIEIEADAEREDVEDDGDPECAIRNVGRRIPVIRLAAVLHNLHRRRFCLTCSPFGVHNTSKMPPGPVAPAELIEYRRKRRNAKTYRYQKRRRKSVKAKLIAVRGGQCEDCGYRGHPNSLEF